uniref:DUF1758 domain-containing protein n=1 Tax=Haemonchus placei TaxID=6290 RepID=A0A0N4XAP5_HAEPC
MNALDQEYIKRKLHIPADSSGSAPHDDNVGKWNSVPTFAHQSGLLSSSPAIPHDPTLLNFVDASILSKLDLPTFDGNLLDYPEFWARFTTLVDNKPQLDDTTKFSLLKSCLRGRALQAIQGLSLTAANYRIAVDILKTHYDDKVTMKHMLFTKLAQLPACDPEGRQLPTLYNRMFSLVRQFCNGGDDSKETALGALLLNKLPVRVRGQIYDRTSNSHNVTPSELPHLLTDIVRKDSTLFEIEFHTRRSNEAKNVDYGFHSTTGSVRSPSNGTITRSTEKQHILKTTGRSCSYCKSAFSRRNGLQCFYHDETTMGSNKSSPSMPQLSFLSSYHKKMSFKIFMPAVHKDITRHYVDNSTINHRFETYHHVFLQQQTIAKQKTTNNSTSVRQSLTLTQSTSQNQLQNDLLIQSITCNSLSYFASCSDVRTSESFQSIRPFEKNRSYSFPSRSSKSYITDEVTDRLNLDTITMEDIVVSTFGSTSSLKLKCGNHNVGMVTTKGAKRLQVKSVPTITGNLLQIQINQKVSRGNFTFSQCKPSILIGNDYFWDVVLSDDFFYRRLPNGYRLLHTTIGDVIINEALDFNHVNAYTSVISNETDLDNPRNHDEL